MCGLHGGLAATTSSAARQDLSKAPSLPADLPVWNFDGSSTEQAPGTDSEVMLKPCAIYPDPFRPTKAGEAENILVLCDTYLPDPDAPDGTGAPIPTNTRAACKAIMDRVAAKEPWFGIEQEYTLFEPDAATPYGWPKGGTPDRPQGPYYCSVGTRNAYGRAVAEAHYRCCMYAGVEISGINGEVGSRSGPFSLLVSLLDPPRVSSTVTVSPPPVTPAAPLLTHHTRCPIDR